MVFNFGFVGAGGRSEIYTTLGERRNGRLVAEVWPMADFSDKYDWTAQTTVLRDFIGIAIRAVA